MHHDVRDLARKLTDGQVWFLVEEESTPTRAVLEDIYGHTAVLATCTDGSTPQGALRYQLHTNFGPRRLSPIAFIPDDEAVKYFRSFLTGITAPS